ncbi:histone deacetylase family protein [Shewanella inventionis]|uniref:Histone deacetylase n=1 Tax=Shewanella inventionis TaxID=1738770 RepID=A0ABQ1JDA4_9GAMM|nr:histone deacetylase [Shewanella inventionis]MCL1158156.1 histone deacetylase [Shewanella inventionis]GGB64128.1 histone deacetylase [Shewanella inventionis]
MLTSIPFVYHASYSQLALPATHRFPTTKYQRLYHHAIEQQLLFESSRYIPSAIEIDTLQAVHCPKYVDQFIRGLLDHKAQRRIGFPWSEQLVNRTLHAVNGTVLCAQLALTHGIAVHLTGGYHHAHYDFGSGFCIFNDLIIAAKSAIDSGHADKVLIFDCDVHQGDGTATLAQQYPNIISCSIHCAQNFPARKQDSDYDIDLNKGCSDQEYIEHVEQILPYLIRLHQPDLILYDAGVDIHQDDDLGYFTISSQGILARDTHVISIAKSHNIPLAAVIGGGYSRNEAELTHRHSQLLIAANELWLQPKST